jgi:hypothetical protein
MYIVFKDVAPVSINNFLPDWGGSGAHTNPYPYTDSHIYTDFGRNLQTDCGIPSASLSSYRIVTVQAALNDWSIYIDGGKGGSSGGTAPLYSTTSNTVTWASVAPYLGAATGLATYFFDGWIAEVYYTNAKQSTADRQRNEGYLAWKWGLAGNLDPSHPYKSAAPMFGGPSISIGGDVIGGTPKSVLFIDSMTKLGQDNPHFTFDPVTNYLNVGVLADTGRYYLNGVPAIYLIGNASGNNWFEGNAGNSTLTGYSNFGTGDLVLSALTSGYDNTGVGTGALQYVSSGYGNVGLGTGALGSVTTGQFNVALGNKTLNHITTEVFNVALGNQALFALGVGGGVNNANTAIGAYALQNINSMTGSTGIGYQAAYVLTSNSGDGDTFIGSNSAQSLSTSGGGNIFIGVTSAANVTGSTRSTVIGDWRGPSSTLQDCIIFGSTLDNAGNTCALDCNYTTPGGSGVSWIWSFTNKGGFYPAPPGIHIYNSIDKSPSPVNYERAILDWSVTANVFRIGSQAGGTGTVRLIAIDGFQKAGAPAAADLPAGTCAFIDDTTNNQTWLVFNKAGTIRKVQLT